MEPFNAGWLSLMPPLAAILIALITKEVVSALLIGILAGAFIYTYATGGDLLIGSLDVVFSLMVSTLEFKILIFTSLLGAVVYLVSLSGGSKAYGAWAGRCVKTKRQTLLSASGLGFLIFIDDYFNCLFVGTVMRPLADRCRVAREKLAWVVDSTAAPVCIIAPVSSWAAAVGASMQSTPLENQTMSAFIEAVPWNLYALLTIGFMLFMLWRNLDFGPMATAVERNSIPVDDALSNEKETPTGKGGIIDMLLPILLLIVFAVTALLYSGGYWGEDPAYQSIPAAIGNSSSSSALCWAAFGTLVASMLLYVPRRIMSFANFMQGAIDGMKLMLPANVILVLAWTLSGVCRDLLMSTAYVESVVSMLGAEFSLFLPVIIYLIACGLSFATGASWATFGILVPIIVPITYSTDPSMTIPVLGATLAGSVFGDHASPISDTSILSAASSKTPVMAHASTQLPYAVLVAVAAGVGYLAAGLTKGNLFITWCVALISLAAMTAVCLLRRNRPGLDVQPVVEPQGRLAEELG
ncbi:Na+/H+ antiporter NhaC family protein [Sutterella sp.]|uniref:Na+/H+ antiporter NhaC family protein n=1 Tax=Sutterella sp. TaxID=1981025 RepID=UPI003FD76755